MPEGPVPAEIAAFLALPNHAVMATLRPDGSPHTVATWYDWRAGEIMVNMDDIRPRLRWLRRDGRVALTVIDPESFYRHVSIIGRVREISDDADRRDIDALAQRYTGRDYPRHSHRRVSVRITVERWHGWDRAPSEPGRPERERLPV